jgi:hypothetical protein
MKIVDVSFKLAMHVVAISEKMNPRSMLKKRPVLPKHSLHQYLPSACCRWPRSKVLSMWMQRLANVAALKARAKDKANSRAKSEWNHEPNHTKKLSTWPPEKWRKR